MARSYSRLADWGDGWIIMSTASWDGPKGKEMNRRKVGTGMLPAGPASVYLSNPAALADRLEAKVNELVAKYNGQKGEKQAQTYREPIAHTMWKNARGKEEITFFELQLSSYGFHLNRVTQRIGERFNEGITDCSDIHREAVISPKDVKLIIKLKTTVAVSNQAQVVTPNTRQPRQNMGVFHQDRRGHNVPALHFLHGLRHPKCKEWIDDVVVAIAKSRESRGLAAHVFHHPVMQAHLAKRMIEPTIKYPDVPLAATAAAAAQSIAVRRNVHFPLNNSADLAAAVPPPTATAAVAVVAPSVAKVAKVELKKEEEEEDVDVELNTEDEEEEEEEEEEELEEEEEEDSQDIDEDEEEEEEEEKHQSTQSVMGDATKTEKEGE
jgi:hypothetical protein